MPPQRGRTKKLIVAFHFQFSDQAAWECEPCRKSGLEKKRRCGWLGFDNQPPAVVWARSSVLAHSCPTSYVTAESMAWVELFWMWKLLGGGSYLEMPARQAEAFCVLEAEWLKDNRQGGRI